MLESQTFSCLPAAGRLPLANFTAPRPILRVPIDAERLALPRDVVAAGDLGLVPINRSLLADQTPRTRRLFRVPITTYRSRVTCSSARVLRRRHRLHMSWVLASPIPAQVVYGQSVRDRADGTLPRDTVGAQCPLATHDVLPITVCAQTHKPRPACIGLLEPHVQPEVLDRAAANNVLGRNAQSVITDCRNAFPRGQLVSWYGEVGRPLRVGGRALPSGRSSIGDRQLVASRPGPDDAMHGGHLTLALVGSL
jgi:hypothetical protein